MNEYLKNFIDVFHEFFSFCIFKASSEKTPISKTKVLVVSGQKNMLDERLKLVNELWKANVEVSKKKVARWVSMSDFCERVIA